jgi:hypothetical protein
MLIALLEQLSAKVFDGDIQQLLNDVSTLVLKRKYSHGEAYRQYMQLSYMYESQDWDNKEVLPLQLKLIVVLELLKRQG